MSHYVVALETVLHKLGLCTSVLSGTALFSQRGLTHVKLHGYLTYQIPRLSCQVGEAMISAWPRFEAVHILGSLEVYVWIGMFVQSFPTPQDLFVLVPMKQVRREGEQALRFYILFLLGFMCLGQYLTESLSKSVPCIDHATIMLFAIPLLHVDDICVGYGQQL